MTRLKRSKLLANTAGLFALCATLVMTARPSAAVQSGGAAQEPKPNPARIAPPQTPAVQEFLGRVRQYMAVREKAGSTLPALKATNDPGTIEAHKRTMAEKVRQARANARQGDVFGRVSDTIRAAVREDAKARSARDVYAAMQEVPIQAPPAVNADYPAATPRATVPPLLLRRLPTLPDGLEYRFMGRDLILLDTQTNLIVDFVHEAAPTIQREKP